MALAVVLGALLVVSVVVTDKGVGALTLNFDLKDPRGPGEASPGGREASTYIRWGNNKCPEGAEMVYTGQVGGGSFDSSGAASNMLCLPSETGYPEHANNTVQVAQIYHVEYSIFPDPRDNLHVVCAVCRVRRATTLMIPASVHCPCHSGWRREYTGYIMANLPLKGRSGVQFICVDKSLGGERRPAAHHDQYGILYHTVTNCRHGLPCAKYPAKTTGCVVCSK
ncbi:short-chain collagen C4-like isoform X2 [Babylonia areolata]